MARRSSSRRRGGAIYGECDGPAPETAERRPLAPYGTSKLAGEEYLATWNRLYGTRHVSLRFGNVYGPRQEPHGEAGVVAIFMGLLRDGGTPTIFGDGRQTRDYVFVGDVARAPSSRRSATRAASSTSARASRRRSLDLYAAIQRAAGVAREPDARARRGSASCSAACSTCRSRSASSAGGRSARSRTVSPKRGASDAGGR